ncbi:MAG TPA: GyrI-like domain-containing protein [Bacteroidota bacterium]|nr:GyrI-like domain-containing protein [Bacteroidota bacterium]
MTPKVDLMKVLYSAKSSAAQECTVPAMNFLMIDGEGDPSENPEFQSCTDALYSIAYTTKFDLKKRKGLEYKVPPLEGLWWSDRMASFLEGNKDEWKWTLMIMQPQGVTASVIEKSRQAVMAKKSNPAVVHVRFAEFKEGRVAQILHVGPYSNERLTIERLHAFITGRGGILHGKHHEIYLGDPSRTAPEKLKTIIRQPFA